MANGIVATYKAWKKYRATYNELNQLSTRQLNDLGIYRHDIAKIAKDAAGY